MAQGHIKKGFFFYFGLFVLLLITVFLVCLVIMMFNPGKTVLWMKYFTANQHFVVTQTTDEEPVEITKELLFGQIEELEINCSSYARVTVQKNRDEKFNKEGIYIINNAKGFANHKSVGMFDYDLTLTDNKLTLNIFEPEGFIYFSKEIEVVLAVYTGNNTDRNFGNINLNISTASGEILLGRNHLEPQDVKFKTVTAKSVSGNIIVNKLDTSSLQKLSLSTDKGQILSNKTVTYGQKSYAGIATNCETYLATNTGNIKMEMINTGTANLNMTCYKGNIVVDELYASAINVVCRQGDFIFGNVKITGDAQSSSLSYAGEAEDIMISPVIKIQSLEGSFILSGGEKADPDVYIKKITGKLSIFADKGEVKSDSVEGEVEISGEGSLLVDLIVADNNLNKIYIATKSGGVELSFVDELSDVTARTDSGKITLKVTNTAKFTSFARKNDAAITDDAQQAALADDKITVDDGILRETAKNPLKVNQTISGTDGAVNLFTNNAVEYDLVLKTDLVA